MKIDNIPVTLEDRRLKILDKLNKHDKSLFTQGQLNYLFYKLKDKDDTDQWWRD